MEKFKAWRSKRRLAKAQKNVLAAFGNVTFSKAKK